MKRKKKNAGAKAVDKEVDFGLPLPPAGLNNIETGKYYKSLFKPEYIEIAERLCGAGFTSKDLAYTFNVPYYAVDGWRRKIPAFKEACKAGRKQTKKRLVAQMILSSVGYDYSTSKTRTIQDAEGNIQKVETTEFKNHQPANHNLLMFALCNIDRQMGDNEWHSKHKLEIENNKNINIQIDGQLASEQIAKLAGKLLNEIPERKHIECQQLN